jgi:hypothetical protein
MRRAEIPELIRKQVNLTNRIIYLKPDETKEGHAKRIPIHKELVPVLSNVLKITSKGKDRVFLIQDQKGVGLLEWKLSRTVCPELVNLWGWITRGRNSMI